MSTDTSSIAALTEQAKRLHSGEVTARALTQAALRRIRVQEAPLHAYITLTEQEALIQADCDGVALFLGDLPADFGLDGELVGAVAEGHERAPERLAVDRSPHLHEAPGAEELNRARHHHVRPAALGRAPLQRGREPLLEGAHRRQRFGGRQPGSRPVTPSTRSKSGAPSSTCTSAPKMPSRPAWSRPAKQR